MGLTPVGSGGDRRRSGAGGGCSGGLIPGKVAGGVVSLTQWTPPPMVKGVLVRWQPVLVFDPWVSVCCQNLQTSTAEKTSRLAWKGF